MPRRAKGVATVGRHGEPRLQLTIRVPASPRQQVRLYCVEGRVPARSLHLGGDRAAATSSTLASFPRGSRSARVPPPASTHTSRARPSTKGPRSLILTTTDRPLARFVTRTRVPSGSEG